MSAEAPGATQDYSSRPGPSRSRRSPSSRAVPGVRALRVLLAALGLAGAVLLVVSTWVTVVEIRVLTTSDVAGQDTRISGGDLHGVALLLVAAFAAVMVAGALRGARPAMVALTASGVLALALILALDVPELDNTGQLARFYEDVSAGAASGFYLETLGAVLVLLAGGGFLLLTAEGTPERLRGAGRRLGEGARRAGGAARGAAARRPRRADEAPPERRPDRRATRSER